jgi:hypothetical protein
MKGWRVPRAYYHAASVWRPFLTALCLLGSQVGVVTLVQNPATAQTPGGSSLITTGIYAGWKNFRVVRNGYDADLLISPNHDRLVFLCRGGDTSFAEIPDPTADLSNLLGQLFSAYPKQRSYRVLVRGYRDQWLRTVEALRSSKQWDFEQGRPVRGDAQDLILRLADTANSYAELSTAWQGYGYTIHARSIEEIHIAPLNKLPAAVRPPGTLWQRSSAKIPYEYNLVYNVILNSE